MPTQIIDTHVHIWDFSKADYPWLKGNNSILNRTYCIDELTHQLSKAGVTSGMLVQASNNFDDTNWMLEVADKTEWICGVVGWLPLMNPKEVEESLNRQYKKNKYFKGVRHLIHDEPDCKWLLQKEVLESLKILADNNLPFDVVGILPSHIETVLEVAQKIPSLKMVFDHLNQPPIKTKEKYGYWGELMQEAAKHKSFCVKISGLGACADNGTSWTEDDLIPYIEFALKYYGEDRCFCGSDWPVSLLRGSYERSWRAYKNILSELLDNAGQEKVYHHNAASFYNLNQLN